MPRPRKDAEEVLKKRLPAATTPEQLENQMISMAMDYTRKAMENGTASSQMIVHFLKLGSKTERLLQEKMLLEQQLLKARADAVIASGDQKQLLEDAMRAFAGYKGDTSDEEQILD